MAAATPQVAGYIELPSDGPWSADALVKECLGICSYVWDQQRTILAGRVPVPHSFDSARLVADMSQLKADLDDLFEQQ